MLWAIKAFIQSFRCFDNIQQMLSIVFTAKLNIFRDFCRFVNLWSTFYLPLKLIICKISKLINLSLIWYFNYEFLVSKILKKKNLFFIVKMLETEFTIYFMKATFSVMLKNCLFIRRNMINILEFKREESRVLMLTLKNKLSAIIGYFPQYWSKAKQCIKINVKKIP